MAEEELQALLIAHTGELLLLFSIRGDVVHVSPAARAGLTLAAEVRHFDDAFASVDAADRASLRQAWTRARRGEAPTVRVRGGDGPQRWLDVTARRVVYRGSPHVIVTVRDATDRQQVEDELRHAQKMALVGRLAVGVAHDINNLLVVMLVSAELLASHRGSVEPESAVLADLREAGSRATALARQLLVFGRKEAFSPRTVAVNVVLEQLGALLRTLLGADIELRLSLDPRVGSVRVDPGQFEQAIINLAANARDAMPDGGLLAIETHQSGAEVAVRVRDSGHGMDPLTQRRVFEPFFTTKEPDRGTGLGLAMVHDFVEHSGGRIKVETSIGAGATFTISLPAVASASEAAMTLGSDSAS